MLLVLYEWMQRAFIWCIFHDVLPSTELSGEGGSGQPAPPRSRYSQLLLPWSPAVGAYNISRKSAEEHHLSWVRK